MIDAVLPHPAGALRIVVRDESLARRIGDRFGALFVDAKPDAAIEFAVADMPEAYWDESLRGRLEGTRVIAEMNGARGEFDLAAGAGRFEIARHVEWSELFLDNVLRMVIVELGYRAKMWICHTAAVADGAAAYLFFGVSGAGKTTVTELSAAAGFAPINDDLVFLSMEGGVPTVTGCPFHGATRIRRFANGKFPVRALFALEQSGVNEIVPLPRPAAVLALSRALVTWRARSRDEQAGALAFADAVCAAVPVSTLRFRKEPAFWELIGPKRSAS